MAMTSQEAENILQQYAAFAPFIGPEGKNHPVWSVDEIVAGLRAGPLPRATRKRVDEALQTTPPTLRGIYYEGNVGWKVYREDLLPWLVQEFVPGYKDQGKDKEASA